MAFYNFLINATVARRSHVIFTENSNYLQGFELTFIDMTSIVETVYIN